MYGWMEILSGFRDYDKVKNQGPVNWEEELYRATLNNTPAAIIE